MRSSASGLRNRISLDENSGEDKTRSKFSLTEDSINDFERKKSSNKGNHSTSDCGAASKFRHDTSRGHSKAQTRGASCLNSVKCKKTTPEPTEAEKEKENIDNSHKATAPDHLNCMYTIADSLLDKRKGSKYYEYTVGRWVKYEYRISDTGTGCQNRSSDSDNWLILKT